MGDVVTLGGMVVGEGFVVDADKVLDAAKGSSHVVVISVDAEGELQIASSHGSAEALWLLERGKLKLLNSADN